MYLNSLIYDMDFSSVPEDNSYRSELEAIAEQEGGRETLHKRLAELDPKAASLIHPNNAKKVIRALERLKEGEGQIKQFSDIDSETKDYDIILIGLTRDRAELYDRVNRRVDILMNEGLLDEVKGLMDMGLTQENISMKGIGYKELMDHLDGRCTVDDAVDTVKKNTRHYAKKQLTWFRRYEKMKWFDISGYDSDEDAFEDMKEWLLKNK